MYFLHAVWYNLSMLTAPGYDLKETHFIEQQIWKPTNVYKGEK